MILPDIQDEHDDRGIALDEVGISGLRYPVTFRDGTLTQAGIATISITVALPADRRGTHMSRMVAIADTHLQTLDPRDLHATAKAAATQMDVDTVQLRISLPIATQVIAPVSGLRSWQVHDLEFRLKHTFGETVLRTVITSDVTSLCPCSKAISDYGAHNQRSRILLSIAGEGDLLYPLPVATAIDMMNKVASGPVIPLVKRPDERALTMRAYDNPVFVEDIVRELSAGLRSLNISHSIEALNLESIHSHDAIARVNYTESIGRDD